MMVFDFSENPLKGFLTPSPSLRNLNQATLLRSCSSYTRAEGAPICFLVAQGVILGIDSLL